MKMQKKKQYKKNIKILLYTIMLLVLPFIILPIFVPSYQLWSPEYALSSVGIFLSAYSLEATILFALLIYKMQKADTEKEHRKRLSYAKTAMATALQSGIRWTFKPRWVGYPGLASTTKEIFLEYMTELQELLNEEQYEFLVQAVETIDAAVKPDEGHGRPDTTTFIKPGLLLLSHSKYFTLFENVWNEQVFLNSQSLELLEALGVEMEEFEESKFGIINDMDGKSLFTIGGFREYSVHQNEEVIFRGILVEDYDGVAKIWSGYEKSKEYVGHYSEGKFHGEGCEYDWHGEKYREGIFCSGELEKGREYNWIVKCDGDDYEKYIQAGKQLSPTMLFDAELEYEGWDKFFVADFEVDGDTERMMNLRPLKAWMEKRKGE